MYQKMFTCPNCGPIVEVYGEAFNVNCDVHLSFDNRGYLDKSYDNHDIGEACVYHCCTCDTEIDINDITEVCDYDPEL